MKTFIFSKELGWSSRNDGIDSKWEASAISEWAAFRTSLGYDLFDLYGDECGIHVSVYQPPEGEPWMVEFNTSFSWRNIECEEFPDVLELLPKLLPMVNASFAENLREIIELGVDVLGDTPVIREKRAAERQRRIAERSKKL
jgi:hypothetical protein